MSDNDLREIEKLQKEKRKAEKKNNLREVAQLCNYIGELLAKHGKFEEAVLEHEAELALSEALEDRIGAAIASRKVGECYCELGQYDKALRHQERHLSLAQACDNDVEEQRAWATIGRTHLFQAETTKESFAESKHGKNQQALKKAENAFCKSLEVCQRLKSSISIKEYMEMKARLLLNLGLIYDYKVDIKKCAEYIKQAIFIAEKHQLSEELYRCQLSLCGIYVRHNKLSAGLRSVEVALQCAVKRKDKGLQCEALTQKAQIQIELEDFEAGKRCLRKAYKMHSPVEADHKRIEQMLKAAVIICRTQEELSFASVEDNHKRMKIYEKLGDNASHLANFRQAIRYYLSMLECAEKADLSSKQLIPIYVSLAQTYMDNKQFDNATEFYRKELKCREGDHEQESRTWLNIAESQELAGKDYQTVGSSYLSALAAARKAKHRKLQVNVLTSLTIVQQYFGQIEDRKRTLEKLKQTKEKYGISSEDELSEAEDSQDQLQDEVDLDDLSETDESDAEDFDRGKESHETAGRPRRTRVNVRRNEKGETPLHRAAIEGNLNKVKKLIEQGHPVNPRDHCGWLPLHEAANHSYVEIVEHLIVSGAWINDRGGQHCGGVTPLHDACNCGNLDVIRLLIRKGANVLVKDDEGGTPLDSLIEYRKRSEDCMTHQDVSECVAVERMLKNLMTGNSPHISGTVRSDEPRYCDNGVQDLPDIVPKSRLRANQKLSQMSKRTPYIEDSEETSPQNSPVHNNTPDPSPLAVRCGVDRNKKRSSNVLDDDDDEERDSDSEMYLRSQATTVRIKDVPATNATEAYKEALFGIGSAVRKAQTVQSRKVSQLDHSANEKPSLIPQNEIVGDDWLVDDMRPTKRKKYDMDGVFSTKSTSDHSAPRSGEKRKHSKENSYENADLNVNVFHDEEPLSEDIVINEDESAVNIIENYDLNVSQDESEPSRLQRSKRSRQLKLTKFTSSTPNSVKNDVNTSLREMQNTPQNHSVHSSQVAGQPMRVKVKVKDKLFLIPVLNSMEKMCWLAEETARRYYSMCGLRPVLTLSTADGAILSDDDLITSVLSANEEVQAIVDSWDLPPLCHRYTQACSTSNTVAYKNISTILERCQSSAVLHLDGLALKASQFHPIFRALQCQYSLREIHLNGNRLGDGGMQQLVTALLTLPNLLTLDLSANEITHNGIKILSDSLNAPVVSCNTPNAPPTEGSQKPLQLLENLKLSFNPLSDSSNQYLAVVIRHLASLRSLSVESCHLTLRFFQTHRMVFAEAFKEIHLEELDFSHNDFGSTGLELLLKSLPAHSLKSLSLAGTMQTGCSNNLSHQLLNFSIKAENVLEKLNLSDCHLSGDVFDDICSVLKQSKTLQDLNLSLNKKLTSQDMKNILSATMSESSRLRIINMAGCGIKGPFDIDLFDAISDKLNHQMSPLEDLSLSCANVNKTDIECLQQIWKDKWTDGVCIVQGDLICLKHKKSNS